MLSTTADLFQLAGGAGPWFALALVLLGIAARVARSQRQSATRQGERIGALERRADAERDRRLQVEAALIEYGIPLPWWPADGPQQHRRRTFAPYDDDDQADEYDPRTSETPRVPPIPPLPERMAAHRRTGDY